MSLPRRILPKLPISFTGLTLGGAQIGNHPTAMKYEDAIALIQAAWEAGIRAFDTAPLYGYGLSEIIYGEVLKSYPREEFLLSTKVGRLLIPDNRPKGDNDLFPQSRPFSPIFDYSYDGIMKSVQESLERLQTNYLDVVHIHDLDEYTHEKKQPEMMQSFLNKNAQGKAGYDALIELRDRGIIRAIGVGSNNWECCREIILKTPKDFIDVIELANRYTLFEQTALELFSICEERGIKVMIAGPLNSGILSGNPQNKYYNYKIADDELLEKRDRIEKICQINNFSLREAALQFLWRNPLIVTIVTGARNPKEIHENIQSLTNLKSLTKLLQQLKAEELLEEPIGREKKDNSSNFVKQSFVNSLNKKPDDGNQINSPLKLDDSASKMALK